MGGGSGVGEGTLLTNVEDIFSFGTIWDDKNIRAYLMINICLVLHFAKIKAAFKDISVNLVWTKEPI